MDSGEQWQNLHKAIEEGNLEKVKELLNDEAPGQFFSNGEMSALSKAFACRKYEIASYLIHKHAKLAESEDIDLYAQELDLSHINSCLLAYNRKPEKSCIFKLMSCSQSPQNLDRERLSAVMRMYEELFRSEIIKLLMMVLEEGEALEIVYDFESEHVNGIQRLYLGESEIYGLTLTKSREVFIGAKNLLSGDPKNVYGVVAEQICHLALTMLFENDAKPYREDDSVLKAEFRDIIMAVKSFVARSCHVEPVIQDMFANYECSCWECELIARVVMIMGMYGEEKGRQNLQQASELSRLLSFYEKNVIPKCRGYIEPLLNTKTHHLVEKLMKKNHFISFKEKMVRPLKENFPSFGEFLVTQDGASVISTNCTKLCTLHVYHELKSKYRDLLEKKCIFLTKECFEKKGKEILEGLKCGVWDYLVVVIKEEDFRPEILIREYLYDLDESNDKSLKIIIISRCKFLDPQLKKVVNYKWHDLSDEFQQLRTFPIECVFKGDRHYISRKREDIPKLFSEKEILKIMSGEVLIVKDSSELYNQGFLPEMYVERKFQGTSVDASIFNNLPSEVRIFLSGVRRFDFKELQVNEKLVQWIEGSDEKLISSKSIFIVNDKTTIIEDSAPKKLRKEENTVWLHYDKGVFYMRNSSSKLFSELRRQVSMTEKEMIDLVRRNRILIISDEPGRGKSTVLSSLIRHVNQKVYGSWVSRVNLSELSVLKLDLFSSSDEDMFDDIFLMLGLNSGAEKCCFRDLSQYGNCFVFLDAFDEIPSEYKVYAVKMISFLRGKTNVNLIITTRKQCQEDLEDQLSTFSFQLVPFSNLEQASYLGRLWKWKLKYPFGEGAHFVQKDRKAILQKIVRILEKLRNEKMEMVAQELAHALEEIDAENSLDDIRHKIDQLDFTTFAANVLRRFSVVEANSEFMEIPLNLYILGISLFNADFNMEIFYNIYGLYSSFIDQKIQTYLEEKQGLWHEGKMKNLLLRRLKDDVYRIHCDLADQSLAGNTGYISSELGVEDQELCSTLGLVSIHGNQVGFIHKSFADFFKTVSERQKFK